jgi:hypothetical protein
MYSCNSLVGVQVGKQHIAAVPSRLKARNNACLLFPYWNKSRKSTHSCSFLARKKAGNDIQYTCMSLLE